jgi:hypothetical protein
MIAHLKAAADAANRQYNAAPCRETREVWLKAKLAYERAADRPWSAI